MYRELRDNKTGEITPFKTTLNCDRYAGGMRFKFDCENSKKFSAYSEDNEPIYRGDVVELFICTGGNRNVYYEIEVAPNGTVFFAAIDYDNGAFSAKMLDKAFEADVTDYKNGYSVEIRIPDEAIGVKENVEVVFNAYRIETEGGTPEKNLLAMNPTMCGCFHRPEYFIPFDED